MPPQLETTNFNNFLRIQEHHLQKKIWKSLLFALLSDLTAILDTA